MAPTFHPDLSLSNIEHAAKRIQVAAVRTPIVENAALNTTVQGRVFLKAESLQRTGSFKFRGAYNKVAQLSAEQRLAGVVACSSGNHAQGLALAAQLFDTQATIVMPSDAPAIKISNTRAYGAQVVLYDRLSESREEIATTIGEKTGALFIPPYDDFDIMAGQGTCGLEIIQDRPEIRFDAVLTAASGGGLTAGVATAFKALSPDTEVYCVEPAGHDDQARSLEADSRKHNDNPPPSICDALLAPIPGEHTFEVNRHLVTGGLTVTDDEVKQAMRFAFSHLKLVLEPGGAASLAAILYRNELRGLNIAAILSGGNVDPQFYAELLQTQHGA